MSTTPPHITQVRQALLDTLTDLRNREAPMDIDRARALAQVAGVLIESVKVENDYLKITGQDCSQFMEPQTTNVVHIGPVQAPSASNPFPVSVRHVLEG